MIRGLSRQVATLEQAASADRAILDRVVGPLIILGPEGRIERINAEATSQFGDEAQAILRHPALRAELDASSGGGPPRFVELELAVPIERVLHARISRIDEPTGPGRVAILLTDRTADRAIERMRADFVANASHELRTPLAGLIGFIETLRGPAADDPPAQQRFLGIMSEQAARMHRLIDDLLDLSRIELEEHRQPRDQVALGALVERAVAALEPVIQARKSSVALTVEPALPPVLGDADQLTQVAQNIIDNALKHGGEGTVVSVDIHRAGSGWPEGPGIELVIGDNGPGIPRDHLPRLTERFYRVDPARSRAAGGTGLGLAIVKHIVNRHRGRLRIESVEGEGSTFRVWLPASERAETRPATG